MEYKWTAMSNTFIATLMASINSYIILIALPSIFNGIHIDPLNSFQYLLMDFDGLRIGNSHTSSKLSDGYQICMVELKCSD